MKLTYYRATTASLVGLISYAVYSREQMYQIVLFLVTSKVSFVILGNTAVAAAFLIANIMVAIFLGSLSGSEKEMLSDRGKYAITETCLALTIFRNELTPPILVMFFTLLFLKAFHWLIRSRVEQLEQIMPVGYAAHLRLTTLMIVLAAFDFYLAQYCINFVMDNGKSVLILFAFEFGLQGITLANIWMRYLLWQIDTNFSSGLESRGLYLMLSDLVSDALKFITYLFFFSFVFVYYGLPIHILREMGQSFYLLQKNARSFVKYVALTKNLDLRFPNATQEELQGAGDCLICREPMLAGKKLGCGHVFHLECLRMWLQHQQSCPLCRAEIRVQDGSTANRRGAEAAAARAAVNGNNNNNIAPGAGAGGGAAGGGGAGAGAGARVAAPAEAQPRDGTRPPPAAPAAAAPAAAAPVRATTTGSTTSRNPLPRETVVMSEPTIVLEELERIAMTAGVALDPGPGEDSEHALLRASLVNYMITSATGPETAESAVRALAAEGRISEALAEEAVATFREGQAERERVLNRAIGEPVPTTPTAEVAPMAEVADPAAPAQSTIAAEREAIDTTTTTTTTAPATAAAAADVPSSVYQAHREFDSPHDQEHERRSPTASTAPSSAARSTPVGSTAATPAGPGEGGFPKFFVVDSDIAAVHRGPDPTSGVVRTLLRGTAVLVTERSFTVQGWHGDSPPPVSAAPQGQDGLLWHRIPDGWIMVNTASTRPELVVFRESSSGNTNTSDALYNGAQVQPLPHPLSSVDAAPTPALVTPHGTLRQDTSLSLGSLTPPSAAQTPSSPGVDATWRSRTGASTTPHAHLSPRRAPATDSTGRSRGSRGSRGSRHEQVLAIQQKLDVMYDAMRACQEEVDSLIMSEFEDSFEETSPSSSFVHSPRDLNEGAEVAMDTNAASGGDEIKEGVPPSVEEPTTPRRVVSSEAQRLRELRAQRFQSGSQS